MKLSEEMEKDFYNAKFFVKGLTTYYIPKVESLEKALKEVINKLDSIKDEVTYEGYQEWDYPKIIEVIKKAKELL
jgi:uncharacterized protein (UPF0335 family)